VIPIGWNGGGKNHFNEEEKSRIIELSRHIDGFYDQNWHGTYVALGLPCPALGSQLVLPASCA
jgi:hypothetical protein